MSMRHVTKENLDEFLKLYAEARGGEENEDTNSEAMFVVVSKYRGIYFLSTGLGPLWIGLQNASARWTNGGKPFSTVRAAIEGVTNNHHPLSTDLAVFYSEDSISRLRWLADRIEEYKNGGDFLLWKEA